MTAATVLIPTHDHASTLGLAVASALNQTVHDLEVLVVGDGVTDEVRDVARALEAQDDRVRFLDLPKGPHRGEVNRHTAVLESRGEIIAYLCDDDLLLPEHVADMTALLADHDLVQCVNGYIDPEGVLRLYVGRLDDPVYVARMTAPGSRFNFVGITGTAHTRAFYDRAGTPWETTPEGEWPDHHQWRRMLLSSDDVRATTSDRMTVIGLPTTQGGRDAWTPEERHAELERWAAVVRSPGGQERLDRMLTAGALRQLVEWTMLGLQLVEIRDQKDAALTEAERRLAEAEQQLAEAERRFATVTASRWWRLGRRIRPGLSGREA